MSKISNLYSCIIAIIFLITISQVSSKGLFNEEQMDAICSLKNPDYIQTEEYANLEAYVNFLSTKFSFSKIMYIQDFIKELLSDLKGLLKEVVASVITIIFAVIVLLSWIGLCCCKCFNCALFSSEVKHPGTCSKICIALAIIFLSAITISSIFCVINTGTMMSYFNGSSCYFLQFFYQSRHGDVDNKWMGLTNLSDILTNTSHMIDSVASNQKVFENHAELAENLKTLDQLLEISATKFSKPMPDPVNVNKTFQTKYSKEYASLLKKEIYLGKIKEEYSSNIQNTYSSLNSLYNSYSQIAKNRKDVNGDIEALQKNISSFNNALDGISDTIINDAITMQHELSKNLMIFFWVIFGLFIGVGILSLIVLPLYIMMGKNALGITLHVLWNLLMVLSITGFIIGAILSAASVLVVDLVPALSYTFSTAFLSSYSNPFSTDYSTAEYFSTCLNGNGDLATALKLKNTNIQHISSLYDTSLKLLQAENQTRSKESTVLPQVLASLKLYQGDYTKSTDTSYGIKDINFVLHDLSIYTDKALERFNKENLYCNRNDRWVGIKDSCPDGYTYELPSNVLSQKMPQQNCLLIQDWSVDQMKKAYSSCEDKVKEIIKEKFTLIKEFNDEHNERLKEMVQVTEKMIETYKTALVIFDKEMRKSELITEQIYDVYYPHVETDTIYAMFNCGGLKDNFIIFFDQLTNYFTKACQRVSSTCLFCAMSSYIVIFFLIYLIYVYQDRSSDKNLLNNLIKNEQNP